MKKWFLFLSVIGATLYFAIMYETPKAYRLLAAETVWFILALFQLWYAGHNVSVNIFDNIRVVNKGSEIPVQLNLRNRGSFPVPFVEIFVTVSGKVFRESCLCSLKGHGQRNEVLYIKAEKAGFCRIEISRILYYDFLHLFNGRRKMKNGISVLVLPNVYPVAMEIQSAFRYYGEDSGLYYDDEEGNDPSEVLEIREYRAGDRLQKIHWKLSQRTDTLMVKEYSEPIGFAVVFLLDTGNFSEAYLETFMSISMEMCQEKCLHYVCYMDGQGVLVRKPVIKEENLYLFLQVLMERVKVENRKQRTTGSGKQRVKLDSDLYDDWYGRGSYHTSIRLTETLELYRQEELVGKIDSNHVEKSLAGLMLEL